MCEKTDECVSLEDIYVTSKDLDCGEKLYNNDLTLTIATWMKLYHNSETSKNKLNMRNVSIGIAEALRKGKIFVQNHGTFSEKFNLSKPYHFFLSVVNESESTYNQNYTLTFHEILDYTLGEIVESIHIYDIVELSWIITEYMLACQNPNMTILYSKCIDSSIIYDVPFDINIVKFQTKNYSKQHSKFSILKYSDNSIRIIISTGNLINTDWKYYSSGLWISPVLPQLSENANPDEGESSTNFKKDFLEYLCACNQPELFGWEALVQRADCSAINVIFIGSIPGFHNCSNLNKWGQKKLAKELSNHAILSDDSQNWPILAQSSSLGYYGDNFIKWLLKNVALPLSSEKNKKIIHLPDLKLIYPTNEYVMKSILPNSSIQNYLYHKDIHERQQWIKHYFYQWKSEKQQKAIPLIKSYTRISPDNTKISWFLLASMNLCISGFGKVIINNSNQETLQLNHYEAGVLFIPEIIIKKPAFPIVESESLDIPCFLLPYDVPLAKYDTDDEPFLRTIGTKNCPFPKNEPK